jgi:hypothetical protein
MERSLSAFSTGPRTTPSEFPFAFPFRWSREIRSYRPEVSILPAEIVRNSSSAEKSRYEVRRPFVTINRSISRPAERLVLRREKLDEFVADGAACSKNGDHQISLCCKGRFLAVCDQGTFGLPNQ